MTRFEIQDLVSQNQDGVTFRALDKSTNKIVSLRRFFPFGQCDEEEEGGEGLDPQEGKAFSSACERLSRIQHPALRKTILGDTDPVDGMPYLVTEWIDGESLADVLGNNTMDPSMIIGLIQQALDVCITLSNTLENEAVWIDTKLEAIIVSNPTECPTFSFRICPFKWLGTQSHQKDLSGIVSMVEALMGWKSKLVSDQAGLGLGGWLKLLRQNPQMKLSDALQSLPTPTTVVTTEPNVSVSKLPVQQPFIVSSSAPSIFTKKSIAIMAISACFTAAIIIFFYQKNKNQHDSIASPTIESNNSDPKAEIIEPQINKIDENKNSSVNDDIAAKTLKFREEIAKQEELKAQEAEAKRLVLEAKKQAKLEKKQDADNQVTLNLQTLTENNLLSPDDIDAIAKMPLNQPVSLKGVVKTVAIPENSKGLYLSFSDPWDGKQIRAVIYSSGFERETYEDEKFKKVEEEYQKLVGKSVTFNGSVTRFVGKSEPHMVHINMRDQIVVDDPITEAKNEAQSVVYTPDDVSLVKKLPVDSPVKLRGTLNIVKSNQDNTAIVFYFSDPYENGQLRGVAYKKNFKDPYDLKTFDKFIGKEILLDGFFRSIKSPNPHLIEIVDLNQISIISE